ncbi:hypothetical protein HYO27_22140 [Vibrio parahaemolyticus]|uniref:hypothetical protein n=1 Tax=Vibrio parahaemolyticus TaxID=670 RepID=UPI001122C621|nr:hypothetical protein [Vibrio parahaemolyticus]MBM4973470.1 hypothetical protein [Vibrio parahaemolyticus]TOF54156.1 hypothetical protein CGJ20_23875 [Vibrio parahaemolyticus]
MSDFEDLADKKAPVDSGTTAVYKDNKRKSLNRVSRELDDKEFKSPAVQKFLIDEIERLERENNTLSDFRDKFYNSDKVRAVLEQKVKTHLSSDIVSTVCMTVGAAAIGFAPTLWSNQPAGYVVIAFGSILIVGGVAAKLVNSWN